MTEQYRHLRQLIESAPQEAIFELMELTGMASNPYVSGSPTDTAFHCGRRSIGEALLEHLHKVEGIKGAIQAQSNQRIRQWKNKQNQR
jgi:hypothetical protein